MTEPTYISGHTLDLIITRESESVLSNVFVNPGLSFHSRVSCNLMLRKAPNEWKTFTTRRLKAIDTNLFGQDIIQSLSSIDFVNDSVDTCVTKYNSLLSNLLDKHAPAKKRRVMIRHNTPWFNKDIKAAKSKKRDLEHKWRKSKLEIDRQLYCRQRQVVKHMIEKAKTSYYSGSVENCNGDQKSLYSVVNKLLHKRKEPVLPSTSSEHDLANKFSDYFVGKIETIRSSFNEHCELPIDDSIDHVTRITEFDAATDEEVKKILMKSPSSSCELDPLPTWLVKECANEIVPFLTCIVNKSLVSGSFPSELKIAYIRPLLKKSGLDKEDLKNYRPIANLSFLGKLIERVVSSRLRNVITEYNLQDPFQSAYRPNHSIETALVRVHNDILREMDKGRLTALVLLDLSAAFDTVDHSIMLHRLETVLVSMGQH